VRDLVQRIRRAARDQDSGERSTPACHESISVPGSGDRARSRYHLGAHEAGAVLAFIIGALVLGAFAPQKTAGFAAPALRRFLQSLHATR